MLETKHFVECKICNKKLKEVTNSHLKFHNLRVNKYKELFPDARILSEEIEFILREKTWSKQSSPEVNDKRRTSVLNWIKNNPEKFKLIYEKQRGKNKHSEEIKTKISQMNKGKHSSFATEFKKGHKPYITKPWLGKKQSKESNKKRSDSCKKWWSIPENKNKVRRLYGDMHPTKRLEVKNKISEKLKTITKLNWQNPNYRNRRIKAIMRGSGKHPNKKELFLDSLIQSNFPNNWKYVGNGEVVLGAGCPDWINVNGQKKVILHHGIYWHLWRLQKLRNSPNLSKQDVEREDIENYKKYGFDCLIIWEDELKDSKRVIEKIQNFQFS